MAVPIILAGIALVTGAKGVDMGLDAKKDMARAQEINEAAGRIAKQAEDFIDMARGKTKEAIERLGRQKIKILSTSIMDFVTVFEKIKNIRLVESVGINELKNLHLTQDGFKQLREAAFEAKDITVNGLSAVGSGALIAYGTYSAVMGGYVGAVASTGTLVGSLSGAAATNATLAWLGGGALGTGATAFGMAGGMAVLGGLVAGPALAIGGLLLANKAEAALNDSYGNLDKAKAFKSQAKSIGTALKGIFLRAGQLTELLQNLDSLFIVSVAKMENIIERNGTNWERYSQADKNEIYKCVQIAQVIKTILDTTLLHQNGELDAKTAALLETGNNFMQAINEA